MPVLSLARRAAALAALALASGGPPPLAAAAGPLVGGRLLDRAGRPVAGAAVVLSPEAGGHDAVHGATGADGVFRLAAPAPGLWRLRVEPPGGAAWEHPLLPLLHDTWLPPLAGRPARAAAPSRPLRRLTGRVTDAATGRPLAGAWTWPASVPALAVRTAADGRFTVAVPATEDHLTVALPGYVVTDWWPRAEGAAAAVRLQPAAVVAGRIIDRGGRPAAWTTATLHLPGRPTPLLAATGGPDGRFVLGGVPPGRGAELRAAIEDARGFRAGRLALGALGAGEMKAGLRLVLSPAAAVRGRVVDGDGRPVARALLRLVRDGEASAAPAAESPPGSAAAASAGERSAADGRFELRAPEAGRFRLEVELRGFASRTLAGLELSPATPLELGDVRLERGVTLAGTVTGEDALPVDGASVVARAPAGPRSWKATSDSRGGFTLDDLAPGEPLEVVVRHPDYVPARLPNVVPAGPAGPPLAVTLRAGAALAGRVVDGAGDGIGGAAVAVSVAPAAGDAADAGHTGEPGGGAAVALPAESPPGGQRTTDADGRFAFRDLPAGTATLRAWAPGHRAAERVGVAVDAGAPAEEIELVLEPGATLTGVVRAPDGAPAAGTRVSVSGDGSAVALAGDDGGFRLDGLAPGPIAAVAEHERYRPAFRRAALAVGENRLDLVLGAGLSVAGHVVDERGAPLAGVEVSARQPPGPAAPSPGAPLVPAASSAADGGFELGGLAPGPLALAAHAAGFVPARLALELGEEPLAGVEVTLSRGGAVHGRLLGAGVGELERLEVGAVSPRHAGVAGVAEAPDRYRVEGLAAGEWTVIAAAPDGRQARATVVVEAGSETEIDLDFDRGLRVTGSVRVDGAPLAGAEVELFGSAGQGAAATVTGAGGAFAVGGLAPGPYALRVRERTSGLAYEEAVELSGERRLDLDLGTAGVSGRVVAAEGGAVEGAGVLLEHAGRGGAGERLAGRTDSLGAFAFPNVPAGEYRLVVRLGERVALEQRLAVTRGADQDLLLRLATR